MAEGPAGVSVKPLRVVVMPGVGHSGTSWAVALLCGPNTMTYDVVRTDVESVGETASCFRNPTAACQFPEK